MMRKKWVVISSVLLGGLWLQGCASPKVDNSKTGSIQSADAPVPAATTQAEDSGGQAKPEMPAPSGVITMTSAVRLTTAKHPAVAEAVGRIRQQTQQIAEARSDYLPKVSGGFGAGLDNSREEEWRPTFNLGASQMVYDFGKTENRINAETAEKHARHAQMIGTLEGLAREAAGAVVEIDRYNSLIAVARDHVRDNERILKLVSSRTDQGASTKSDSLQAQARVQAAKSTLLDAESQLRRWQSTLSALTGLPAPIKVDGSVPVTLRDACSKGPTDWSKVSSVMKAEADMQGAEAQLRLSRAEIYPTLSLEGSVGMDVLDPMNDPDYNVGLRASASLYSGGSTTARRKAASFAVATAQAAKAKAILESGRNLAEAAQQIGGLEQRRALLRERERTMKATRDLYEVQYKDLGTRTLLDLLNAADEFHGARFEKVNATHDISSLKIDCSFFSGQHMEAFSIEEPES